MDQLFTSVILHNSLGLVNPLFSDALGLRQGGLVQRSQHHHLSIAWTVPDAGIVVRSLTATNSTKSSVITDLDLADTRSFPNPHYGILPNTEPYVNSLFNFQSHIFDRSQELRVETVGSRRLDLLLGGSYVYADTASSSAALLSTGASNQLNGNPVVTKTTGIFGSASFKLTNAIVLSAEGRYQIDNIALYNRGADNGPLTKNVAATFRNFLPRVIAKWQFTPNLNVYASYSKAVNPGTFNANFIALTQAQRDLLEQQYGAGTVVKPEKLDNYEVGAKGRFWQGRAEFEAAYYHAIWSDQIVSQSVATTQASGAITVINAITNIGKTALNGFEVEGAVRPVSRLTINYSGAIAASDIKSFYCATCGAQTGNPYVTGKQLPRYSKYTAAAGVDYHAPISPTLEGYGRVDYIYKSGVFDSPADLVRTQNSNRFNFRAGIRTSAWSLEGFVLNAFNDRAYLSIENQVDLVPGGTRSLNLLMPTLRQFGVRGRYNF